MSRAAFSSYLAWELPKSGTKSGSRKLASPARGQAAASPRDGAAKAVACSVIMTDEFSRLKMRETGEEFGPCRESRVVPGTADELEPRAR